METIESLERNFIIFFTNQQTKINDKNGRKKE
jgi:hypothetical protein